MLLAKRNYFFVFWVVATHVIFFLLALHFTRIYNGDSYEYIYEALNIKSHFYFYCGNIALPFKEEYLTFRTPLYPLLLAAIYYISINNWLVLILQNILSVCNILFFRKTILLVGYKPRYDSLFLLLLIFYPAQFIHANIIEPEILLQSFVLIYIHQFVLLIKNKKAKNALGMSLALVAGLFTKPVLYPFVVIHFLILAYFFFFQKIKTYKLIIAAVIPLCAVGLYNSWNEQRTGKFHFTSNQSFNSVYYFYLYKSKNEGTEHAKQFLSNERSKASSIEDFRQRYDYSIGRGKELLGEHFFDYTLFHLQNSLRFFFEPGKADIDLFTGKLSYGNLYHGADNGFYATVKQNGWVQGTFLFSRQNPHLAIVFLIFLGNVFKFIFLIVFAFNKRILLLVRFFSIDMLFYFALLTGPIVTPRYVVPVSLLYIGCAVLGYQYYIDRRTQSV